MINKRQTISLLLVFSLLLSLSGCATMPPGPSVSVMPPPGKSFDEFRADDATCSRQWAAQVTGQTAQDAANQSAVKSAALGTILTAGLGAIIGAAVGHWGTGAAIGAASGLFLRNSGRCRRQSGVGIRRSTSLRHCLYAMYVHQRECSSRNDSGTGSSLQRATTATVLCS